MTTCPVTADLDRQLRLADAQQARADAINKLVDRWIKNHQQRADAVAKAAALPDNAEHIEHILFGDSNEVKAQAVEALEKSVRDFLWHEANFDLDPECF